MKAILFIAALALFFSPMAANANLILNPGFEGSTSCWTFSKIGLLDEHYQARGGAFCLAGNPHGGPTVKTIWVSAGSVSNLHFTFDTPGNSRQMMGWTAATTAALFASQTNPAIGPDIDFVQSEKKPDQIPASIIFFAPGLAGILVRRNWPQRGFLRRTKRRISELSRHVYEFPSHGDVLKRMLLIRRFITYFQFVHFKLRTIQLNQ